MPFQTAQPREPLHVAAFGTRPSVRGRSVLTTSRLVLRPLVSSDERAFIAAVSATRVDLNEFCPLHRENESDADLFERHLAMSAIAGVTRKAVRLVVTPICDSELILGAINLNEIAYGFEARATANWWLVPAARASGVASEAVGAVLEHAFADHPSGRALHRVDALIDPANFRSLRLAERLRMRPQPGQYERVVMRGGAKVHQLYSSFAPLAPLPASMIELKPLPGLEAILSGSIRI
jgi:ribosomal-protein-alanine N-acetyltransferase